MTIAERRFPYFSEAAVPEAALGWESMYPDFLVPTMETQEQDNPRFWFADTMHWARGCLPFDSIGVEGVFLGAGQNSTRIFVLPVALGLDVRIVKGYVYISPIPVDDPAEIAERAAHFQERAGYYYTNWDDLFEKWKVKVVELTRQLDSLDFTPFPPLDPIEVVTQGRGRSTTWEVVDNYHRLIQQYFVGWEYHFEFLNLAFGGFITFSQFCRQAFPQISEQDVARMVAGVDGVAFQPAAQLRNLAELAVKLDVVETIGNGRDAGSVLDQLASSDNGREWLASFTEAQTPWFDYYADYGFAHDEQTWASDLSIPLQGISRYAAKLLAGQEIHRPIERLLAERDELVDEYRALLTAGEAAQFDELLALVRKVFPFIEEHNIYIEHWFQSVFWKKMHEVGEFLVTAGFLTDADDVFYLNRFELDTVLYDVSESWVIGREPRGTRRWAAVIRRRRGMVAALKADPPAPAYGIPPERVTDPFAVINYGVTTERVQEWLGGSSTDSSTFSGIPGSPGVVEGIVRVLRSEKDLPLLQAGEILVAPTTAPSWGAAFAVVAGVITDIGGMMSHTSIVCREYGIPAVVGTGVGTQRLRDGQRVRVVGDTGLVTVLEHGE